MMATSRGVAPASSKPPRHRRPRCSPNWQTWVEGLSEEEAEHRLEQYGPNVVADEARYTRLRLLVKACSEPPS